LLWLDPNDFRMGSGWATILMQMAGQEKHVKKNTASERGGFKASTGTPKDRDVRCQLGVLGLWAMAALSRKIMQRS
jgi:hypothetical protein